MLCFVFFGFVSDLLIYWLEGLFCKFWYIRKGWDLRVCYVVFLRFLGKFSLGLGFGVESWGCVVVLSSRVCLVFRGFS